MKLRYSGRRVELLGWMMAETMAGRLKPLMMPPRAAINTWRLILFGWSFNLHRLWVDAWREFLTTVAVKLEME